MGSVEILDSQFLFCSHIITYGNSSTPAVTEKMREEIETMWNEPEGIIKFEDSLMRVIFKITDSHQPAIQPLDIYQNLDPGIIISALKNLLMEISLLLMVSGVIVVISNWRIYT